MTNSYWRERELDHINKQIKNDAVLTRQIRRKYIQAMDEIQNQIEAFYGRYADAEGISITEARKRVSKLDMEKYSAKAKRYVKERNFTKRANEELLLYNATMKINRLQLLRLNIELELLGLISDEERFLLDELTKSARAEYERLSGILGESINHNEKAIKTIVNSSFMSATWSDRLWANQTALRAELDKLLHRGIVQGKNPRELARELRKTFDASVYNSKRLLITEMARVQEEVFEDSMRQAGIGEYEYIAEPTACDICADLDGKVFKLEDAEVGKNMYPMHPFVNARQRHTLIETSGINP